MNRATTVHHGRPLYSRVRRGYAGDIASIEKLRFAVLGDKRISMRDYTRICHHVREIVKYLTPFAKGKTRKR